MATVKKHVSKDGKVTYYIRVFNGFDGNGKKIEPSFAWKVPEGMKPKQVEKELQRQIMKFEEEVKNGSFFKAQSLNKTDFYTNTGNISNPLMILAVMEKLSPNERMILFFSFEVLALNLNAHHAR